MKSLTFSGIAKSIWSLTETSWVQLFVLVPLIAVAWILFFFTIWPVMAYWRIKNRRKLFNADEQRHQELLDALRKTK